jgi:8-oxo-dGTP diphosphatase
MPLQRAENRVYVGAYGFCRDPKGRLLLARLTDFEAVDAGRWTLPGGGVQWGEHPEQAVRREMDEETGLADLEICGILEIYSQTYNHNPENLLPPLHHVGIVFRVKTSTYQVRNESGGTTDLCQWLDEDQARALPLTTLGEFGVNLAWPQGIL